MRFADEVPRTQDGIVVPRVQNGVIIRPTSTNQNGERTCMEYQSLRLLGKSLDVAWERAFIRPLTFN